MAQNTIQKLIDAELNNRQILVDKIMDIVHERYQDSKKAVLRGNLQQYVYERLGLKGRKSNDFCRFMNRIMAESGYRAGWLRGPRVFYGLEPKPELGEELVNFLLPAYHRT